MSPFPDLMLLSGRVLKFGGRPVPIYQNTPAWKARVGRPKVEFPSDPQNILHRLVVGRSLAGYWGQLRARYTIPPR